MQSMLFVALALGSLALVASTAAPLITFIDVIALGLVLAPAVLVGCAAHGPRAVFGALAAGRRAPDAASARSAHVDVLRTLRRALHAAGVAGAVIGAVASLSATDPSELGPAVAVSLMSVLYGVIAAEMVVEPMARRLEHQTALE